MKQSLFEQTFNKHRKLTMEHFGEVNIPRAQDLYSYADDKSDTQPTYHAPPKPTVRPSATKDYPWLDKIGNRPSVETLSTENLIKISDEALDKAYHYGLSKPGTFGYEANKGSVEEAMSRIKSRQTNIEKISEAVHEGWSKVAKSYDDPVYKTKPEKKEARLKLANMSYNNLPEEEKEKDRVVARALLGAYLAVHGS